MFTAPYLQISLKLSLVLFGFALFIWSITYIVAWFERRGSGEAPPKPTKARRIWNVLAFVFVGALIMVALNWSNILGADREARETLLKETAAEIFAEPLTEEQFQGLVNGEVVPVTVAMAPFTLAEQDFVFRPQMLVEYYGATDITWNLEELTGGLKFQREVFGGIARAEKLEELYGINLNTEERIALAIPAEGPANGGKPHTTYDTTQLTLQDTNGDFSRVTTTLIWDGEFKLVGGEIGEETQFELPRAKN